MYFNEHFGAVHFTHQRLNHTAVTYYTTILYKLHFKRVAILKILQINYINCINEQLLCLFYPQTNDVYMDRQLAFHSFQFLNKFFIRWNTILVKCFSFLVHKLPREIQVTSLNLWLTTSRTMFDCKRRKVNWGKNKM
jgi:hypothetical protein